MSDAGRGLSRRIVRPLSQIQDDSGLPKDLAFGRW